MKMVKSLLLGTAAGLVAMTGAQAADLPVKAKPVQYVKICSLYGAGFYYIPGTDTCLKVGGWVRSEMNFNANGSFNPIKTAWLDSGNRGLNQEVTRTRAVMTLDTRSQTEYGTLRSYMSGGWDWTNGSGAYSGDVYAARGFIQWAGITAGRAQSFFDFYSAVPYSNQTNVWGSDTGGGGDDVFAYTAQLGNGLSVTLSAEDTQTRRGAITGDLYAGRQWPDAVANLRLDQAWGSAQVMGAMHQVRTFANTVNETGYALGAGATVKLPMLGAGDSISAQFTYAKGAMNYVGQGIGSFGISQGTTTGYGRANDGTITAANAIDLTQGWSVVAGFGHSWNKNWKTSLYGSYGSVDHSDAASTVITGVAGNNADWKYWQVGSRTVWTPVANLDLSVDVMYNKLITSDVVGALTPVGGTAVAADQGWWQGMFRFQRNFYP